MWVLSELAELQSLCDNSLYAHNTAVSVEPSALISRINRSYVTPVNVEARFDNKQPATQPALLLIHHRPRQIPNDKNWPQDGFRIEPYPYQQKLSNMGAFEVLNHPYPKARTLELEIELTMGFSKAQPHPPRTLPECYRHFSADTSQIFPDWLNSRLSTPTRAHRQLDYRWFDHGHACQND